MLEKFFNSTLRIQELRDGPSGHLLEGFAEELRQAGYSEITARAHIRAAEHLIYWAGREGLPINTLNERFVEDFGGHLDRCQCPQYGHTYRLKLRNGVRLFFKYLQHAGVVRASIIEQTVQDPVLLASFCEWMRQQRGTCSLTWRPLFQFWRIGGFRLCRGTYNRMKSNGSLCLVILPRRLARGIARFYSCLHAWAFGRAISSSFGWAISTGMGPGFKSQGKGAVRRAYR